MITQTARARAAQGLRSVASMRTVPPRHQARLREFSALITRPDADLQPIIDEVIHVLVAYEDANPFHRDHGDVPLGLRRVVRLLTGEQAR